MAQRVVLEENRSIGHREYEFMGLPPRQCRGHRLHGRDIRTEVQRWGRPLHRWLSFLCRL